MCCTWRVKRDTIPSFSWKTDLLQEFLMNTLSKLVAHTWSDDFEMQFHFILNINITFEQCNNILSTWTTKSISSERVNVFKENWQRKAASAIKFIESYRIQFKFIKSHWIAVKLSRVNHFISLLMVNEACSKCDQTRYHSILNKLITSNLNKITKTLEIRKIETEIKFRIWNITHDVPVVTFINGTISFH